MIQSLQHLPNTERRGMLRQLPPPVLTRLLDLCSGTRDIPARRVMSRAGDRLHESLMLLEGIVLRHVSVSDGRRQMVAMQVPFDFVDLHSLPLGYLDHDVESLTPVKIAVFPHDALRKGVRTDPEVAMLLWRLTLIDAAIHRQWSFRLGGLRALPGMANFLCEIDYRLRLAGCGGDESFALPLTQNDLGDVCGLSAIHVNRVLRELREARLCSLRDGIASLHDRGRLRDIGEFEHGYLYDSMPGED
jgi:CRP-like cAMP-binding protein